MVGGVAAAICAATLAGPTGPGARDAAWVSQRAQAWQPTAKELRWEQIGWAKNLTQAEQLAAQLRRPVFLYTHDGRLNVGRC